MTSSAARVPVRASDSVGDVSFVNASTATRPERGAASSVTPVTASETPSLAPDACVSTVTARLVVDSRTMVSPSTMRAW
ncbi:hypothetical protein H8R02_28500 [Ramlibacter sp. GTP1]|uniref:Uncharacterized protein n=1 Tax=Ramlibacter albus TaxID=2079448 RepID=A0A923MD05_9BURK|nr:hypothetical protein [Ramlibacter albus]MBC5768435.1 hypothetical protein [Ramlibacter albus]